MLDILHKLLPVFIGFVVGYTVRQLRFVRREQGAQLLRLVFYVTIPPLVFVSVVRLQPSAQLAVFLVLPIVLALCMFGATRLVFGGRKLVPRERGVVLSAPLVINSAFSLALLLKAYGPVSAGRVALFNAVNTPILFTAVYAIAASHNPTLTSKKEIVRKVLLVPALWALCLGLLVNMTHLHPSSLLMTPLLTVGNLSGVLAIIALGIIFNPQRAHAALAVGIVSLRVGLGLAIGLLVVLVFHLQGIDRAGVLLLASAPIGTNLMAFASLEKLDGGLAASAVSYSLIASLVLAPFLLWLAR